jgi:hypothetical protein
MPGTSIQYAVDSTTLTMNGFAITDFIEGDFITMSFPNPLTSRSNGANDAVNINEHVAGRVCDMTINVIRNSKSDELLKGFKNQSPPAVFNGSLKENFVKNGSISGVENWILENGSITTFAPAAKNNQQAGVTNAYTIQFRSAREV